MNKLRNWFASLPPMKRRSVIISGSITLLFIGFSLATISDLLVPANIQELIVNPIPIILSLVGIIATWLAARGKTRQSSYLFIVAVIVGFIVISIFSAQPIYSSVGELIIVVVPLLIAVQSLSEREFTWIVVITIICRSAVQIIGSFKPASPLTGASALTASIAQWASIGLTIIFIFYVALNLNNYSFRIKMILALGIMTIVPTAILTSTSSNYLQNNLFKQANQSLVLSSDQLASAIDLYMKTALETTRIEAQIPGLEDYLGQPRIIAPNGEQVFARGTDLEKATLYTLRAIQKKDPLNIIAVRLIDWQGIIQLSTNESEIREFHIQDDFFITPFHSGIPYAGPVIQTPDGNGLIHLGAAIRSSSGNVTGVLDIVYSGSIFQEILARNSETLGTDVSAMLLDDQNIILAHSSNPALIHRIINPPDKDTIPNLIIAKRLQDLTPDKLSITMDGLTAGLNNLSTVQYFSGDFQPELGVTGSNRLDVDQAGASKLPSFAWTVVTFIPRGTLLAPVQQQTQAVIFISILISLISIGVALGLTQVVISPILSLTRTSERVTQGDINATATVHTQDEIGTLANTFNVMTGRVRDLITGLEQRVAERTKALERRAIQLQAAGDVGSAAARLRDLDEMLRQTARLISQRFGFYHVGIFLLDDLNEYAVLRASNSEGGQRMLARQHKLKVGTVGIVGFVTGSGQPRIALNVGQDSEYFNNPDLPLTQSEMALPLIAGGKVLGALDIQSTEPGAFSEEDVNTLKVLADQTAVAIENARLFTENQSALETARRAYGELSIKGWQTLLQNRQTEVGYTSAAEDRIVPASSEADPKFQQAVESGQPILANGDLTLFLPIKIRGQGIGAIRMERNRGGNRWTQEDVEMASTLSEQLGTALESARLYADTRQRAEREYIISDIASKIGASIQIDTILRTSVEELGRAFSESEISIQMGSRPQRGNGHG